MFVICYYLKICWLQNQYTTNTEESQEETQNHYNSVSNSDENLPSFFINQQNAELDKHHQMGNPIVWRYVHYHNCY